MSEAPAPSLRTRIVFGVGLVLVLVLLTELVLTFAVAETVVSYRPSRGGVRVPFIPGAEADLVSEEFNVRYRINGLGYRDRERSAPRTPGVSRVVVIGDSFAEGWGISQDRTFAAQLEDRLGIEVWNTARHGGNPLWYVVQARRVIERFAPDLLVVQLFDNDPWDVRVYAKRFAFDASGDLVGEGRLRPLPGALRTFWDRRQLPRFVRRVERSLFGEQRLHPEPFYRAGANRAEPLPREEVARRRPVDLADHGRHPFLGFFASPEDPEWQEGFARERRLLLQLARETRSAGVAMVWVYAPDRQVFANHATLAARRAANPHWQLLAAAAREADVPLVDGQAFLAGAPDPLALYFVWDGHWNEAGHARAADALAPVLAQALAGP